MNEIADCKEREQLTTLDMRVGAVNTVRDRIEAALELRAQQESAATKKVAQASMDRAARGVIEHNYEKCPAIYKAELQKQASDIAVEVDAAYAENNRRIAAKEDRNRAECESMADAPQVEAERAIGARSHDAKSEGRTIESMELEAARRMAAEDLEDLRRIKMPERLDDAAVVIQYNMRNPAYKAEFERLDAEAAISVKILAAQAGVRIAPKAQQENRR